MEKRTSAISSVSRRKFIAGSTIFGVSAALLGLAGCASTVSGNDLESVPKTWDMEADIVIVGGGGAGASAACTAAEEGASVLLLEKGNQLGGDTALSGQAALGPWIEQAKTEGGVDDTIESNLQDLKASHTWSAKGKLGEDLPEETPYTQRQLDLTGEMLDWTKNTIGVGWVAQATAAEGALHEGVYPQPQWNTKGCRSWLAMDPTSSIFVAFNRAIASMGVPVRHRTEVTNLIVDSSNRVVGVRALDENDKAVSIKAGKAVILATGTFCGDRGMMDRYLPVSKGIQAGGSLGVTGDGQKMAQAIGGALVDMDLGAHWYVFEAGTNSGVFATSMIFYGGLEGDVPVSELPGILINYDGKRFMSESDGYKYIGEETAGQPCHESYYVLDSHANAAPITFTVPYTDTRIITTDTLEELAALMRVPADTFLAQVDRYNGFVTAGSDTDFGKLLEGCQPIDQGPFYAICLRPRPYATYGGIKTDVDSHVLDSDGHVISGLYAAGICTGSYVEQEGMYYSGGLSQALAFGRQAAKNAVADSAWAKVVPTDLQTTRQSVSSVTDCSSCHSDGRRPGDSNYHGF